MSIVGGYASIPLSSTALTSWRLTVGAGAGSIHVGLVTPARRASNDIADYSYSMEYTGTNFIIREPQAGGFVQDLGAYPSTAWPLIVYDGVHVVYSIDGTEVRKVKSATEGEQFIAKVLVNTAAEGFGTSDFRQYAYSDGRWTSIKDSQLNTDPIDGTTVGTAVDTAFESVLQAADDGFLTPIEKKQVLVLRSQQNAEKAGLENTATSFGATTEKTNYTNAYNALGAQLLSLNPAWDDVTQASPLDRAAWTASWTDYTTAREALIRAVEAKAAQMATWSSVSGAGRPADFADVTGENVAASVAGQGALATKAAVDFQSGEVANRPYALQEFTGGGDIYAGRVRYNTSGALVADREPQEVGANVTENRVATGIAGQGGLATKNTAAWDAEITGRPGRLTAGHPLNGDLFHPDFLAYTTGVGIDGLRPQEAGSNITENRVATGIAGQGQFATWSVLPYGTDYINGLPDAIKPINLRNQAIASEYVRFDDQVSLALLKPQEYGSNITENRVATGIAGQGGLATRSSITFNGDDISSLPASINPGNMIGGNWVNANYAFYDGSADVSLQARKPQEAGANITENRVATGIAGQGNLATRNTIEDGYLGGQLATRLAPHPYNASYLSMTTLAYSNGADANPLKPEEGGANITENRVASSVSGQGALATANKVNWLSQVDNTPALDSRDWTMKFDSRAAFEQVWDTQGSVAEIYPINSPTSGDGGAMAFGNQAGADQCNLFAREWMPYDGQSLYEVTFDVFLGDASTNTIFYAGVQGLDKEGNNLGGSYNYCCATAVPNTSYQGRRQFRCYLKGWAPVSSTNNALGNSDAINANGLPDGSQNGYGQGGVVKIRPVALINYGGDWGYTELHGVRIRRLSGVLSARDTIADGYISGPLATRIAAHPTAGSSYLSATTMAWADGELAVESLKPGEYGANVTENRVATGIAGQGGLATRDSVLYGSHIANLPMAIQPANMFGGGELMASNIYNNAGNKQLNTYYPEDIGSNRTENRVASSIAGQSAWATYADTSNLPAKLEKIAPNAGTSGLLRPIGQHTRITGNIVGKIGGVHGAWEGGAVGLGISGPAFISSSIASAVSGGGWITTLNLDPDPENFNPDLASVAHLRATASPGSVNLYLSYGGHARNNQGGGVPVGENSRLMLAYDGHNLLGMVDGKVYVSLPAKLPLTVFPKIMDFYHTGLSNNELKDVIYGPYSNNDLTGLKMYDGHTAQRTYVIEGNRVSRKQDIAEDWDNNAYSAQTFRGGAVASGKCGVGTFLGISVHTSGNYGNISWAWHRSADGNLYVYDNASGVAFSVGAFDTDVQLSIIHDGYTIRWYQDGMLKHTSTVNASPSQELRLAVAVHTKTSSVSALSFSAFNGELGANKTETRVAASIVGQAAAATDTNIEAAADVTKAASGPATATLNYAADGTLTSTVPKLVPGYALTPAGGSALTSGVTWAVSVAAGSFVGSAPTVSVTDGQATLNINSGISGADATVHLTPTYNGKSYPPVITKISRNTAPPPSNTGGGGGGTSGSSAVRSVSTTVSSTTPAVVTTTMPITVGSGGSVLFYGLIDMVATLGGSRTVTFKFQRESSPGSGSWSDVTGASFSGEAPINTSGEMGTAYLSTTLGSQPTGSQVYRVVASLNSDGSVDVTGEVKVEG